MNIHIAYFLTTQRRLTLVAILLFSTFSSSGWSQQILLDKQILAGELTLYPVYKNEQNYHYLPNKPRLSLDDSGLPQFSFIRFVRNNSTGAEDGSISRSDDGGGIVTALIELGVSDEQLRNAELELQGLVPGAKIIGPVTYDVGKFSLNSVFADANGDRTEQVLGIGSSPLVEGSKAAISLQLTTKGARQLWASFDMPTPNITFHFEMQFDGLLSPQNVHIEADYKKIYSHHSFNVAATGQAKNVVFGTEIDAAFSDLRRDQAIRINAVNPDADMNKLIKTTNKFIMDTIFKSMNENDQELPDIADAGGVSGQSLLDKASALLKDARAAAGKTPASATSIEQCEPDKPSSNESTKAANSELKPKPEAKSNNEKKDVIRAGPAKSAGKKSSTSSEIFTLDDDIAYIRNHIEFIRSGGTYEASEKVLQEIKDNFTQLNKFAVAKEYAKSIVLSHKSFSVKPHASALYNIAQSYRQSGDTNAARVYYQLYLEFIEVSKEELSGKEDAEGYLTELPKLGSGVDNSASSNYRRLMNGDLSDEHLNKLGIQVKNNSDSAIAVFGRAQDHVAAINYVEAGREFRNAYNLFSAPDFIFNMAFSYQELDYPAEALLHYKTFQTLARYLSKTADKDTDRTDWENESKKALIKIDSLEKEIAENASVFAKDKLDDIAGQAAGGGSALTKATPVVAATKPEVKPELQTKTVFDSEDKPKTKPEDAEKTDCKPKKVKEKADKRPVLSVVARYQFRREKQAGTMHVSLTKHTSSTQNDNFDENIGDLSRLKNDERFFRTVNLDDDQAYDQREIVVMLNGLNSADFDNFINFASVKLRKIHESGAETIDDIRIDKANIDRVGNKFILLYGNKGDTNRDDWLNYEFQTTWNFAGGHEEGDTNFQQTNGEAIALSPPIERRPLQIEADPDVLVAANIRAVDVKVFWTIDGQTSSKQVLLRVPNTSAIVPVLAPTNNFSYDFEITWMRGGGLPDLQSGRQVGSSSMLFVDNLPDS